MGIGDRLKQAKAARRERRDEARADASQTAEISRAASGSRRAANGDVYCGCGAQMMPHPGVGYSCGCSLGHPSVIIPDSEIGKG